MGFPLSEKKGNSFFGKNPWQSCGPNVVYMELGEIQLWQFFQVKYGVKYHVLQIGGPLVYTPTTCQQETSSMSGSMYSYVQMAKTVNLEDNPVEKGHVFFEIQVLGVKSTLILKLIDQKHG